MSRGLTDVGKLGLQELLGVSLDANEVHTPIAWQFVAMDFHIDGG